MMVEQLDCFPRPGPGIYSVPHEKLKDAIPPAYLALGIAYSAALVSNLLLPKWCMFIATAFYLILTIAWVVALTDLARGVISHRKLKRFRVFSIFLVAYAVAHGWVIYTIAYWSEPNVGSRWKGRPHNPPNDMVFLISPNDNSRGPFGNEISPPMLRPGSGSLFDESLSTADSQQSENVIFATGEQVFAGDENLTTDQTEAGEELKNLLNFAEPLIMLNPLIYTTEPSITSDFESLVINEEEVSTLAEAPESVSEMMSQASLNSLSTDYAGESASSPEQASTTENVTESGDLAAVFSEEESTSATSSSIPVTALTGGQLGYLAPGGVAPARLLAPWDHQSIEGPLQQRKAAAAMITMRIVALLVASHVFPWVVLGVCGYRLATKLDLKCPICQERNF